MCELCNVIDIKFGLRMQQTKQKKKQNMKLSLGILDGLYPKPFRDGRDYYISIGCPDTVEATAERCIEDHQYEYCNWLLAHIIGIDVVLYARYAASAAADAAAAAARCADDAAARYAADAAARYAATAAAAAADASDAADAAARYADDAAARYAADAAARYAATAAAAAADAADAADAAARYAARYAATAASDAADAAAAAAAAAARYAAADMWIKILTYGISLIPKS